MKVLKIFGGTKERKINVAITNNYSRILGILIVLSQGIVVAPF